MAASDHLFCSAVGKSGLPQM